VADMQEILWSGSSQENVYMFLTGVERAHQDTKTIGDLGDGREEPPGACRKGSKAVALIALCRLVILDIDDEGVRRDLIAH
jgi:hypothetical protein